MRSYSSSSPGASSFCTTYRAVRAPRGARRGLGVPAERYALAVYSVEPYGAFQSYAQAWHAEIIPPLTRQLTDAGVYPVILFIGPRIVDLVASMRTRDRPALMREDGAPRARLPPDGGQWLKSFLESIQCQHSRPDSGQFEFRCLNSLLQ
ncbi:hypothetical protein EDB86DRAFT_2970080 [Lactarius hatsudake]|nr:hypothetical protein EDB86DRAFT_2970080 [Lactarius hatsudake]